jgi:hypothetical protein
MCVTVNDNNTLLSSLYIIESAKRLSTLVQNEKTIITDNDTYRALTLNPLFENCRFFVIGKNVKTAYHNAFEFKSIPEILHKYSCDVRRGALKDSYFVVSNNKGLTNNLIYACNKCFVTLVYNDNNINDNIFDMQGNWECQYETQKLSEYGKQYKFLEFFRK